MTWGPLIAKFLSAIGDLLFLWKRRVKRKDKEEAHEKVQTFRKMLVSGDTDRAAYLLERRLREARSLRQRRAEADKDG